MGLCAFTVVGAGLALAVQAQQDAHLGYSDTPMLPGNKWHVHDGTRPYPKVIEPATPSTQEAAGKAPSDATVLFDGTDLSKWRNDKGGDASWILGKGYIQAKPGSGSLVSRQEFGDCQFHIEFAMPDPPRGTSQDRGNSGVFFFGQYEIQVLDSYKSPTYADGHCAAIYGQYPPLVNACRKPGEWQTYDIIFNGPRFADGKVTRPAYATVIHNGVVVHNHTEVLGPCTFRGLPKYSPHGEKGVISLQDHGHPVRFRNIWIRELKEYDQP